MNPEQWSRPRTGPQDLPNADKNRFVGKDGKDLLELLSRNPTTSSSITIPTKPEPKTSLMQSDLEGLLDERTVGAARGVADKVTEGVKTATTAAGSIFSSLGDITKIGLNKTASSPAWVTGLSGGIGLIAGIKAVKNLLNSAATFIQPMRDPNLGWLPHTLIGLLQGGLCFGLTAPFFGRHNLFTEHIDGKPVVRIKTLVGATLAPFMLGVFMNLAKGVSRVRKIPFIGPPLEDICKTIFGASREITVATESNPQAGAPGAGMPAPQMAA